MLMKPNLLLLLTLLVSTSEAINAAEKAAVSVYGEIKQKKAEKADDGSEAVLQKLLTVKGVPEQYKLCQTANIELAKIPQCIWEGNAASGIAVLGDDVKKQVQQMYAAESASKSDGANRSPASAASAPSNLTNKSKQIGEDYMSDPAVVELSNVLQKKLEEAMLGDQAAQKDTKKVAVVDHSKYIELYKTELGKTIVSAFTSYCIEADFSKKLSVSPSAKKCTDSDNKPAACPLVILSSEADKRDTITKNIAKLNTGDFNSSTKSNPNTDSEQWNSCIAAVSNVCYTDINDFVGNTTGLTPQIDRSKIRACTIMDYVKSARKNLIIADEQKKFFDGLGPGVSMKVENARTVVENEKNSMDAVTTVTSKDIEDSYKSKNLILKKEMDKCLDASDTTNGKIIDAESCKKFISTDTEAKKKALTEFGIRQFALEDKIDDKFKNKAEVQKYLEDEGYETAKINQIIGNPTDLESVKKEISTRYKNERDAIISSMAEKIKSQTTSGDGKIDTTSTGSGSDQDKLAKIRAIGPF
jgi:hypothetical protein